MDYFTIFCHYSESHILPQYLVDYLIELKKYSSKIILVTNIRKIKQKSLNILADLDIIINFVENRGHDFGMYNTMMQKYRDEIYKFDNLILVNDSSILVKSLKEFFESYQNGNFEYYGMTDYYAPFFHIQSYFLVINKSIFNNIWSYFSFNGIKNNRDSVILTYEIGLSLFLRDLGKRIGSFYSSDKFFKREEYRDMTIYYPDILFKYGVPLIKRRILSSKKTSFFFWLKLSIYFKILAKSYRGDFGLRYPISFKEIFTFRVKKVIKDFFVSKK